MAVAGLLVRAVSLVGLVNQIAHAELRRNRHRLVAAGIVDEQDVVDDVARNLGVGLPQRACRVVRGHDDDDALAVEHQVATPQIA